MDDPPEPQEHETFKGGLRWAAWLLLRERAGLIRTAQRYEADARRAGAPDETIRKAGEKQRLLAGFADRMARQILGGPVED